MTVDWGGKFMLLHCSESSTHAVRRVLSGTVVFTLVCSTYVLSSLFVSDSTLELTPYQLAFLFLSVLFFAWVANMSFP